MNIIMMTNTYKPILGGLEKSVEAFTLEYRKRGHRVIIIAPVLEGMTEEEDVIRVPALQHVNGTDFSAPLPIPGALTEALGDFRPDIVHANHPFWIGDTALRLAEKHNVPLVFTHHTLYEQNTHYVPGGDSEAMKRFVIQLSTGYANLADQVFAPSGSIKKLIEERGVTTPVEVVPTGIDLKRFAGADPKKIRERLEISPQKFVVGHLGRLAPEKNLEFLTKAVIIFLRKNLEAHFLLVGKGPSEDEIKKLFLEAGLADRLHLAGVLSGQDLVDAYHAMDVFVFASQSETQGLVLTEAMASGVPVVGVDAPGVREVILNKLNGRLLLDENLNDFSSAIEWVAKRTSKERQEMKTVCLKTAESFSMEKSVTHALKIYTSIRKGDEFVRRKSDDSSWAETGRMIHAHWELTKNLTKATAEAILGSEK